MKHMFISAGADRPVSGLARLAVIACAGASLAAFGETADGEAGSTNAAGSVDAAILASSPTGFGVYGDSHGTGLTAGVYGEVTDAGAFGAGVRGEASSESGTGVLGINRAFGGQAFGVHGVSSQSPDGVGVRGDGGKYGVWGRGALGVYGESSASGPGVVGFTLADTGGGVRGEAVASDGFTYGVHGISHSDNGVGLLGEAKSAAGFGYGVSGVSESASGRGVSGFASGASAFALHGRATGQFGKGLYAEVTSTHSSANAILAKSGGGDSYAAYLIGRVFVDGALYVNNLPTGNYAPLQYNAANKQFYYDNSSRRSKENITPLNADFGAILEAEPVQYTRPGAPERVEVGYIAEDMQALGLEALIGYNAEGQVETFNYQKMILYVVEVLKENRRDIDGLQAENARLQRQLAALLDAQSGPDVAASAP